MSRIYQDASGKWQVEGPYISGKSQLGSSDWAKSILGEPLSSRQQRYQQDLNNYNSDPGWISAGGKVPIPAEYGLTSDATGSLTEGQMIQQGAYDLGQTSEPVNVASTPSKSSAMTGQPTTYEEQLKSSIPGTLANDDIVMGIDNIGLYNQIGNPTLPANTPEISTAPTETTSPVYTPATDYTVPATTSAITTPTENTPTLPTGTNAAVATTAAKPSYGGSTTYGKKYKSPFAASGAWPVTNKKYPYKSSLFKTQASELI